MATADCTKCGQSFSWHAGRGCKLADIKSPCCGAPAKAHRSGSYSRGLNTRTRILAEVRLPNWYGGGFNVPSKRQLIARGNGGFQIGYYGYFDGYFPTNEFDGDFRYFRDKFDHKVLVKEADYQRLTTKMQSSKEAK